MIDIRPAVVDDLPALLAIQALCYPPELVESADVFEAIVARGHSFVAVNTHRARVLGFCIAHRWPAAGPLPCLHTAERIAEPRAANGDALFIHDLSVHPEARQSGIGRALVRHVVAYAARALPDAVTVVRLVAVQGSAYYFWSRHGFQAEIDLDTDLDSYRDDTATAMRGGVRDLLAFHS